MVTTLHFSKQIEKQFELRLQAMSQELQQKSSRVLKIDMHCHDKNSNVPDELLGRILGVPETWIDTSELTNVLRKHKTDVLTITNHNNARSCFDLLNKGQDVLVGAEFTCAISDLDIDIHVLTYGFSPAQETQLNKLRHNLYAFLDYTNEHSLPTTFAHPLHFHAPRQMPSPEKFAKMILLFERFEGVNGQRSTWQNDLSLTWLESFDTQKIEDIAKKCGITPTTFCKNPFRKQFCGGSDDHFGLFAGATGTLLAVPNNINLDNNQPLSAVALEILRNGSFAPYGISNNCELMTTAFLDFFCQTGSKMKDPGLFRVLLHQGEANDKLFGLLIANGIFELRRHKTTMRFMDVFDMALRGKPPGFFTRMIVPKVYRPFIECMKEIAVSHTQPPAVRATVLANTISSLFHDFLRLLASRVEQKSKQFSPPNSGISNGFLDILKNIEISTSLRALTGQNSKNDFSSNTHSICKVNITELLDGLSFPFLASGIIGGAHFASARVMWEKREFLNQLSESVDTITPPKRALWLTDTFGDNNGVSMALGCILDEIQKRDLPIDFCICHPTLQSAPHLIVIRPLGTFQLPNYEHQPFRFFDFLEIHHLFASGNYDRLICSTEGFMGATALFLKHAANIPAYFYVHTDWLEFSRQTMQFDPHNVDRVRRFLRAFYQMFDGVFLLNSEQFETFAGPAMNIPREALFRTSHWVSPKFVPQVQDRKKVFPTVNANDLILLFVGRLSEEKGVMELPAIFATAQAANPKVKMIIAGEGPCEKTLRAAMPHATFLGWVGQEHLPEIYSCADLLLLPSTFDTFGCVILEALSCGLPVCSYNTKGPRDLISHGKSGFLADTPESFIELVKEFVVRDNTNYNMRDSAIIEAARFSPEIVLSKLLKDINL